MNFLVSWLCVQVARANSVWCGLPEMGATSLEAMVVPFGRFL
jgi:hypothetical protein